MRRNKTAIAVAIADPTLDRPEAPPSAQVSDHAIRLKHAEQLAMQDAKGGSIGVYTIQYLDGADLPVEAAARKRLHRERESATNAVQSARSVGRCLQDTGGVNLVAHGPTLQGEYQTTLKNEDSQVDHIRELIKKERADRDALEAVLSGRRQHSDGIVWTGSASPQPGPDTTKGQVFWSSANMKDMCLTWVPLLTLGPVEAAIIVTTMKAYMRTDDWIAPIVLSIAFLAGLVFLPSPIGICIARMYRRGFAMTKEIAVLAFMLIFWLGAVVGTVFFRVQADRASAIRKVADMQQVDIGDIDPAAVYNMPIHIAMWAIPVGLIGVAVIVAKVLWYNPVIRQILQIDYRLVALYLNELVHSTIRERGQALIDARVHAAADVVTEWEHYRDKVLPAQCEEYCAHYRRWLGHYSGKPEMVQALHPITVEASTSEDGIVEGEVL